MLNKITGPKARSRHTLGSVSATEIAKRLVRLFVTLRSATGAKVRETPTAAKLFTMAYVRAKDKSFSDDRSKAVWIAKQVPTSQEDDNLFLEAARGRSEKGTIYGLGNAAEHFYKRPTTRTSFAKPSCTPSIVSQLQSELDSTKTELNSTKNELQEQRQYMENQQQMMEEQRCQLQKQQKMMEEQRQMLLAMQAQMKLMSQLRELPI
ncbi:hypothetical protein Cgig2_016331 [Carnegiea gigantea]|uniref:Uncharacterized protein n=1 Tax=Carnegiea gigantea TaxID=171969 RepID=A0A9Q1JW04_9CARY|nr:hypothetical protein Cgig2_016331 [Carnegiea gigantea]